MTRLPLSERGRRSVAEQISNAILAALVALLVFTLAFRVVFEPVFIEGTSMMPTISNGDVVAINKLSSRPKRGKVVVIDSAAAKKVLIKRVVAVAGDKFGFCMSDGGNEIKLYVDTGGGFEAASEPYLDIPMDPGSTASIFTRYKVYDSFEELESSGGTLVSDRCFIALGDNRNNSADSRMYGEFSYDEMLGTVTSDLDKDPVSRLLFDLFYPVVSRGRVE